MAERFYVNLPLGVGAIELDGPEAHHLATVCRVRAGQNVVLFNGDGHEYPAQIRQVARRTVSLEVLGREAVSRELPFQLVVAAPIPKGDRLHFLVEKLTEVGVTTFVPLKTTRSVIEPGASKRDRMERFVIEATKQCGRNVLMNVAALTAWCDLHTIAEYPRQRVLAKPGGAALDRLPPATDVLVAIGPEGGWTPEELAQAEEWGWEGVSLGSRILRIETAALALSAWLAMAGRERDD